MQSTGNLLSAMVLIANERNAPDQLSETLSLSIFFCWTDTHLSLYFGFSWAVPQLMLKLLRINGIVAKGVEFILD